MMNRTMKKIISYLLCLCMISTLMPVLPASAAEGNEFRVLQKIDNMPNGFVTPVGFENGFVVWLDELDSVYRVNVGIYNVPQSSAWEVSLKYDKTVVQPCLADGNTFNDELFEDWKVSNSGWLNLATYAENSFLLTGLSGAQLEGAQKQTLLQLTGSSAHAFGTINETAMAAVSGKDIDDQYVRFDVPIAGRGMANDTLASHVVGYTKSGNGGYLNAQADGVQGNVIKLYSGYFKLIDGQKVTDTTFMLYPPTGSVELATGSAIKSDSADVEHSGTAFVNFPNPPEAEYEVEITVKSGNIVMPNASVAVTGTSVGGNEVSKTGTTDSQGKVTLSLPASDRSGYKLKIEDVTVNGKNYTMAAGDEYGKTFDVSKDQTTFPYVTMREVTSQYTIKMKFTDLANTAVDMTDAQIKFGAMTPSGTENGELTFTVPTAGQKQLTISGVKGFQNIVENKINFMVTATGQDQAKIELVSRAASDAVVTITGTAPNQTINVALRMATTNVTVPLPVPEVDGNKITVDQAENMTLTFKPVEDSSDNLKAEAGENGFTAGGSAVTVTPDSTDSTLAGSITVDASIPDGAYEMIVGGAGFDSVKVPVTVVTDNTTNPPTRVVNVGGNATVVDGEVTEIEGGVTASNKTDADANGNGAVDLTGKDSANTTIVEGGNTIINSDGTVDVPTVGGDVTDKTTSGLLDTDIANPENPDGGLTPSVVTDPIYLVEVEPKYTGGGTTAVNQFTAKVYLKNAEASSGTFGMSFDPAIFSHNKTELSNTTTMQFDDLRQSGSSVTGYEPEFGTNKGSGYVFFQWSMKDSQTPINAKSGQQLIATITLDVQSAYQLVANLETVLDQRSIYTMDFNETKLGEELAAVGAEQDELIGSIWRKVGTPGSANSVHIEKDEEAKATRGGFYQFSAPHPTLGYNVQHDIRMDFKLPELMDDQRADFWVTEPDGTPINKAEIKIYTAVPTEEAMPDYTIETDEYGYAHKILPAGTYYYTVTEGGHWAYPDGTATTDTDGVDYDSFEVTADGVVMLGKVVLPESGTDRVETPIVRDYINPVMEATTYHSVMLDNIDDTSSDPVNASITSPTKAYNTVRYYFTVEPDAGYQWKLGTGETLADVAAEMKATLYTADKDSTDPDTAFRGEPIKENITVNWDAVKEQFYIEGDQISGDAIGEMTIDVDPLRAGDLVILVPAADRIEFADYTITATAGTGGEMKVELDATLTDGSSDAVASNFGEKSTVTETLSGGRTTSAIYTFKGTDTNKIAKVVINGVEQAITEQQKENGYTYQFVNVSGDQTIYVSFTDEEGKTQLSDPYVAVESGPHGEIGVKVDGVTPPIDETVDGPDKKTFTVTGENPGDMTLTIKPDDKYEIDSVLIDGKLLTDAEKGTPDSEGYYTNPLEQTLTLNKGDTHSVVVTFKPKGEASTHVIVTAKVVDGFGVVSPAGNSVYTVGATPKYLMTPNDGWELDTTKDSGAVMLDGKDRSDAVAAPGTGETDYSYTLPKLTGNVVLEVTFTETGYTVQGKILIQALVDPDSEPGVTVEPAKLVFERKADPANKIEYAKVEFTSDNKPANPTSGTGKLLKFDHKIPVGVWTVTVSKPGYLEYEVTAFEVKEGATNTIYFGDSNCLGGTAAGAEADIKPIILICGDAAGEGKAVAANDVSMVVAGWLNNALATNQKMGDLNENNHKNGTAAGGSDTVDMGIVKNNMSKVRSTETYDHFCTGI